MFITGTKDVLTRNSHKQNKNNEEDSKANFVLIISLFGPLGNQWDTLYDHSNSEMPIYTLYIYDYETFYSWLQYMYNVHIIYIIYIYIYLQNLISEINII